MIDGGEPKLGEQLGRPEQRAERDQDGTDAHHRERHRRPLDPVRHQQADAVAFAQPGSDEATRHRSAGVVELGPGDRAIVADERLDLGIGAPSLRDHPWNRRLATGHRRSPHFSSPTTLHQYGGGHPRCVNRLERSQFFVCCAQRSSRFSRRLPGFFLDNAQRGGVQLAKFVVGLRERRRNDSIFKWSIANQAVGTFTLPPSRRTEGGTRH